MDTNLIKVQWTVSCELLDSVSRCPSDPEASFRSNVEGEVPTFENWSSYFTWCRLISAQDLWVTSLPKDFQLDLRQAFRSDRLLFQPRPARLKFQLFSVCLLCVLCALKIKWKIKFHALEFILKLKWGVSKNKYECLCDGDACGWFIIILPVLWFLQSPDVWSIKLAEQTNCLKDEC